MAIDQTQIAAQMVAQLRVLDPSASAEVGTPERKILDTVAQGIAESAIDLNLISGSLDLSSKFGEDLDKFLGLFGFGRQQGARSTGFVTFSRATASAYDIAIPNGTQVAGTTTITASTQSPGVPLQVIFQTTSSVTLRAGESEVSAPIEALLVGAAGNIAAGTITDFANLGSPPLGITDVTNAIPTTNGADLETDPELKVRFTNTVFRNLAGTQDQYMALATATQFTTKANVIGPISRYQEFIQVPAIDDAGYIDALFDPSQATGGGSNPPLNPSGARNHWTTALTMIPYAKYIHTEIPYFVSNGGNGVDTLFYRQDTDFVMRTPPVNEGDTYREWWNGGQSDGPNPANFPTRPNFTLTNVYTGTDSDVQSMRPGDVVLAEFSYLSSESRNDALRNIANCVDIYINGENPTTADAIVPPPEINLFTRDPNDKYYIENYRRFGEPDRRPIPGNLFMPLFWQPTIALPSQIVAGTNTFFLGMHYWLVEDVSSIGNTVRTRNGIEWLATLPGATMFGDKPEGPYTGDLPSAVGVPSLTVTGYTYDKNIVDLQAGLDGNKQVTTDVLAHRSRTRYFKLDLTVMYANGINTSSVNQNVQAAVTNFFNGQYFGSIIRLSDLLQVVRGVPGIINVRFSRDVLEEAVEARASAANQRFNEQLVLDPLGRPRYCVQECDVTGQSRTTVLVDRMVPGSAITDERWRAYWSGNPTFGYYTISQGELVSDPIYPSDDLIGGFDAHNQFHPGAFAKLIAGNLPVTVSGIPSDFTLTFTNQGFQTVPLTVTSFLGGDFGLDTDFFLKDNELPALPTGMVAGDTLPGLILRSRTQNTWSLV